MPNILPPASNALAATLAASSSPPVTTAVPVAITALEATIEDLTRMIQTNATVTSEPTANQVTLTTALGNLTVAFAQQLSTSEKANLTQQLMDLLQSQKPLTLVIQPGSPPTQGTLLLPQQATVPATPPPTSNVSAPVAQPTLPPMPLQTGDTFPAIVLSSLPTVTPSVPPPASQLIPPPVLPQSVLEQPVPLQSAPAQNLASTPVNPLPAAPGMPISQNQAPQPNAFVLLQTTPQETPVNPAAYTQAPQALPSALPLSPLPTNAPIPTPAPNPQIAVLLQPGTELNLHVDALSPPPLPNMPQPALPPLALNQIQATVTGTGSNGGLILKAGDTSLFIKTPVTAPVGTSVIMSVDPAQDTQPLPLPASAASNFPSLPQTLNALAQANPQIAQQVLNNNIPQPTPALSGALLFLFSAFKSGNPRDWLGHAATESLSIAGKIELLKNMSTDLTHAGQTVQDPVVGEWRSYPIPLFVQQQFQALTLHVHSDRDARQEKGGKAGIGKIRFLIDMRLSKLGDMQIDGFVQPQKLDMILRSENFLPEGLHNELRDSYQKALGAVGYGGALNFQVGRQYWMRMQNQKARGIVT